MLSRCAAAPAKSGSFRSVSATRGPLRLAARVARRRVPAGKATSGATSISAASKPRRLSALPRRHRGRLGQLRRQSLHPRVLLEERTQLVGDLRVPRRPLLRVGLLPRLRSLQVFGDDRVEFLAKAPRSDYLERYHELDLGLDPFPYNGHTTTFDALWMGVPVLTLAGPDARGRQGVSILNSVGLPEFVADSPEQFDRIIRDDTASLVDVFKDAPPN